MLNLGLTAAEMQLFNRSLYSGSYQLSTKIQVLTLDHEYVDDLSDVLQDGQVNIDNSAAVTRSATVTVLDPDASLGFDSKSPGDGSLYQDRMIRIVQSIYSELLPKWVDVPIFCGPIVTQSRDDGMLTLECQGKESRHVSPRIAWTSATYKKGAGSDELIKKVMKEIAGESKFDIPNISAKTSKDLSITTESVVWDFVKNLVPSGYQLFYDGRGVLRLRQTSTSVVYTFEEVKSILSIPKASYDGTTLRNAVYVKGGTPNGKKQIISKIVAPASHPASPVNLGSAGVPWVAAEIVSDDKIDKQDDADDLAKRTLAKVLLDSVNVSFDAIMVPHLEPGDVYTVKTKNYSIDQVVTQMTIPLIPQNGVSMGYTSKRSRNVGKIRR